MRKCYFIFILFLSLFFVGESFGQPMSGTYYIGAAGTAPGGTDPEYATLKAACDAVNAAGVGNNINFLITSNLTEAANVGLGVNTNGFSITFRPSEDVDRIITFTQLSDNTSPTGHFVIGYLGTGLSSAWSDANTIATSNVTIDGYAVGGSTRRLTFTNTSASHTNARVIVVVGACENTVIKNSIINNLTTHNGSPFCVGAVVRVGTAIDVAPINLTFENNILTATGNNVAMGSRLTNSGTPTSRITGFVFKDNIVTARRRLLEINYTTGGEIYNNEWNTIQTAAAGTISYGLWTSTGVTGTFNIYNNKFIQSNTLETGAFGHRVVSLAATATYNLYNNMFSGFEKTSVSAVATNLTYLFFSGVAGTIYNNTFYMPALTNSSSTGYYNCIQLQGNTAQIKNNIFISDEATHTNPSFISAVPSPASDYNVFHMRQTNVNHKVVSTHTTLAAYQAANPTKDVNSIAVNVTFISATDLHIDATVPANITNLKGKGTHIASVTTDIDGDTRKNPPDLGADEFFVPGGTIATGQSSTLIVGGTQRAAIMWDDNGGTLPSAIDFTYMPNTTPPGTATGDKVNQYWVITNTGGSGFTYDVTLNYDDTFLNGIAESNLRVAKSEDGGNTYTAYLATGTGAGQYQLNTAENWIKVHGLTSFSQFTLTSEDNPLPVELTAFKANVSGTSVTLNWATAVEVNNYGFEVQRASSSTTPLQGWEKVGFVKGYGNSNSPKEYTFTDNNLSAGAYSYRLKQIDNDGTYEYSTVVNADVSVPAEFTLSQNYPNPFNPVTNINYTLPVDANVQLYVFSITGELIKTIVSETQSAGSYSVSFDGSGLASGTYIYRLIANDFVQTNKMVLLK